MASTSTNTYVRQLDRELRSALQALSDVAQEMEPESMTDEEALALFNLLVEVKRLAATGRARFAHAAQLDEGLTTDAGPTRRQNAAI